MKKSEELVSTQDTLKALESLRTRFMERLVDIALKYSPSADVEVIKMNMADQEEYAYVCSRLKDVKNLQNALTRKELK